jgi:cellulose synthase/poly-beta-1,6-N-acetylglucosamine synthase-like glycosyltransferase
MRAGETGPEPYTVSVVVTTYERPPELLAGCLRALYEQDWPPSRYELVVVDDGSSTPPLARALQLAPPPPGLAVRAETIEHAGVVAARNHGLALARGDWVAYVDDDATASATWLRRLAVAIDAHPDADRLAGVGGRIATIPGRTWISRYASAFDNFLQEADESGAVDVLIASNSCYRADVLRAVGGYHARWQDTLALGYEEDELALRLRGAGYELRFVPDAEVGHHARSTLRGLLRQWYVYGTGAATYCDASGLAPAALLPYPVLPLAGRARRSIGRWREMRRACREQGVSGLDLLLYPALDLLQQLAFALGFAQATRRLSARPERPARDAG